MTLDLSKWPHANDLLDQALALPRDERPRFVRDRAADDPSLAAVLQAVLAEAGADDGFLTPGGALSSAVAEEIWSAPAEVRHALAPGARIEHYEVIALVGRGGMGEVYRARDTKLGREVALKVLPDRFARDPERLARFRREARLLASLNHPGIGAIFGVAESEGIEALVLELVPGQTLAERLDGGELPLGAALTIGRQLAEAIGAAHARGILHRDLKPANIKLAPDGAVKILDFGLAKALADDAAAPGPADITGESPRVWLGTAPYMSPELARGEPATERTDIWAFGCVLFEMLTGSRAFPGTFVAEVLARVMEREPAFGLLPRDTPAAVRRLLRRCLEKDPQRRLGYIGDALLEFDDAAAAPVIEPVHPDQSARRRSVAALAAGLVAGAAAAWLWWGRASPAPPALARFIMPLPPGDEPVAGFQPMVALSPDGQTVVYRARRAGVTQLFTRALDALEPTPIPGTENATGPFFSPDGRSLGFDADGVLKRVALAGGTPVTIGPAPGGATAAWLPDDTIVFATNTSRVLQRVPASGGTPVALTTLDHQRGDTLHLLPQPLPGGRDVLFTIVTGTERQLAVARTDGGDVRLIAAGTHGRYLPDGHLVFSREGSLWAARFDLRSLAILGQAVPLEERVAHTDGTVFHFAASSGSLLYLPPRAAPDLRQLVWIDRSGRASAIPVEPRPILRVGLAPDGARMALAIAEAGNTDIWVANPERGTMSRLTLEPTIETMPTWSPDGRRIAFRSEREGPGLFQREAQGAGPFERLTATEGPIHSPYSWTPDGRTLLFAIFRSFRSQAIASVTPPDQTIRLLLDGNFAQLDPQVSPDGRWMAYQSDETGRFEIYVRPYPAVETGRWQISTEGGTSPRWSPDGRELFYFDGGGLAAVRVTTTPAFAAATPARLFPIDPFGGRLGPDFEVSPDGRRFLFLLDRPAGTSGTHLVLVQHWSEELRSRLDALR